MRLAGIGSEVIAHAKKHAAEDDLVLQNLPLCKTFAGKLHKRFPTVDYEILEAACLYALVRVARVFDPSRGKISTPLWTACLNEGKAEYAKTQGEVELPFRTYPKVKKMIEYRQEHGRLPNREECDRLFDRQIKMTERRYGELLNAIQLLAPTVAIDRPRPNGTTLDVTRDQRLSLHSPPAENPSKPCEWCGREFEQPKSHRRRYCSHQCRVAADRHRREAKAAAAANQITTE